MPATGNRGYPANENNVKHRGIERIGPGNESYEFTSSLVDYQEFDLLLCMSVKFAFLVEVVREGDGPLVLGAGASSINQFLLGHLCLSLKPRMGSS